MDEDPVDRYNKEAVFTINGKTYTVEHDCIPADTSLNTYIRSYAHLTGTKFMCLEGGCGACVVNAKSVDPITKAKISQAVNSCLVPVLSCNGWEITTIEGIGSKLKGYNELQTRLTQLNGTQCGYCTPGMIMNMYSLLDSKKQVTMKEVENSFGGNICRCTGYRPILDTFKSFASDASPSLKNIFLDIEELDLTKICSKDGKVCIGNCKKSDCNVDVEDGLISPLIHLQSQGSEWYTVTTVAEILVLFSKMGNDSYMLVAGNTAQGVYRLTDLPKYLINISSVKELKTVTKSPSVIIGANITLTAAMALFNSLASEQSSKYAYLKKLADHIDLVANVPVRNIGTIAGNLSIKHQHNEFPSDIFLILETAGATLNIIDKLGRVTNVSLLAYLKMDMRHKLIKSITIPARDETYIYTSYKIMSRAQNTHAYVNAGFLLRFQNKESGIVWGKPTIVFGGINPTFIHASQTEEIVQGKNILHSDVLQIVLKVLNGELKPDKVLPEASPEYRKGLAKALFYKCILNLVPEKANKFVRSGGQLLTRPLSSGKQTFEVDKSIWPLNQPIPKMEALVQCSGEAKYMNDLPQIPGELYAAFVLTTVGQGNISKVDPSKALAVKGVVKFIDHKGIPGKNNFTPELIGLIESEEILCSGKVLYAGQPLGIIVAVTREIARRAAKLVEVKYTNVKKPLTNVREVLKSGDTNRVVTRAEYKATDTKAKSRTKHVIKGSFEMGGQYHFSMETQTCVCIPIEDGMDVYSSTQWMNLTQQAIAQALGVKENSINLAVRRLGGAYGCKISRATLVSTACAIAADAVNKPVHFILSLEDNMQSIGKRYPYAIDYEVGVDNDGVITYLDATMYEDSGCHANDMTAGMVIYTFINCYNNITWTVTSKGVRTDVASNTYCRAPGTCEGIAMIENIMENIAKVLNKDPTEIRLINMVKENNPLPDLINDLKTSSGYDDRMLIIEEFNKENRWKKRGMSIVPMQYPLEYIGDFHTLVSIYAGDGTVAVAHGGIESGQGINTKIMQVCAYTLGIPLEMVSIKPSNNLTAPNDMTTGGSYTSESCAYATTECCKELLRRLQPIKDKLNNPTWQDIIAEAYKQDIDLCATYMFIAKDVSNYKIYGVTACEVEVDVLTGQHQILRVDLLEDVGVSMSPNIDVGQVEGAYIMGLGYWLLEELIFNPDNGELLTNRTWNYKVPGAKDIPIDFRITFRKNAPNPLGVLRSKATGEPPLCMSSGVLFALRNAITSARQNAGKTEKWFQMNAPATTENIFLRGLTEDDQFKL